MNKCFFIGKIMSDIDFKFVKSGKYISIIQFRIKLFDKNKIRIKGYDDLADYCYRNLKEDDTVLIEGKIETEGIVNASTINKIS